MGYLRQPTHIEKTAFFKKLKDGFKRVVDSSPIGLANKAVKAVTGFDAMSSATNLGSKMLSNAWTGTKALGSGLMGGLSAAWKGATDPNASMMSRMFGLTPIGMSWNMLGGMAKGTMQSFQGSMGGAGSATNLGSGGAHTNL